MKPLPLASGLAALSLLLGAAPASAPAPRAPAFTLPDLVSGQPVSLASRAGHPTWITFWASWCGPCREELPHLERFAARWQGRGLRVLGVSLDKDPEMAQAFLHRLGVKIPSVIDTEGKLVVTYGADRIPLNLLLDGDLRVVHRLQGFGPQLFATADAWVKDLLP